MIARRRSCCPASPVAPPSHFSMELQETGNGDPPNIGNGDEFESACSTPFASAPSSPGRSGCPSASAGFFFFSAPSSPMHYVLSSQSLPFSAPDSPVDPASGDFSFEFGFSARFPAHSTAASADELFLNGQIRPMKLSSHLQRPQALAPLPDLAVEEEDDEEGETTRCYREMAEIGGHRRDLMLRSRSVHRRARSLSPLRNLPFRWRLQRAEREKTGQNHQTNPDPKLTEVEEVPAPPVSASSRSSSSSSTSSSSSSRSSKRWIFLKDLLHRSRSEGSGNGKDKIWHGISLSVSKDRPKPSTNPESENKTLPTAVPSQVESSSRREVDAAAPRPANVARRRRRVRPSAHERLYTENRAQAEEMRRRTFLPYRQGLLGCLWFSSRSYGAINGFARSFNPVRSR